MPRSNTTELLDSDREDACQRTHLQCCTRTEKLGFIVANVYISVHVGLYPTSVALGAGHSTHTSPSTINLSKPGDRTFSSQRLNINQCEWRRQGDTEFAFPPPPIMCRRPLIVTYPHRVRTSLGWLPGLSAAKLPLSNNTTLPSTAVVSSLSCLFVLPPPGRSHRSTLIVCRSTGFSNENRRTCTPLFCCPLGEIVTCKWQEPSHTSPHH